MSEFQFMEASTDTQRQDLDRYLNGLKHRESSFELEKTRRNYKRNALIAGVIALTGIISGVFIMNNNDINGWHFLGLMLLMVSIAMGFITFLYFMSEMEDHGEPGLGDLRKLDIAMRSSDTVKRLVFQMSHNNQGILTPVLINELYEIAEGQAAGTCIKMWESIADTNAQKEG